MITFTKKINKIVMYKLLLKASASVQMHSNAPQSPRHQSVKVEMEK